MDMHLPPQVHRTHADILGGEAALRERVEDFRKAKLDHARTVGVPAPTEDPLVEHLARSAVGFDVVDHQAGEPPTQEGPTLAQRVLQLEAEVAELKERMNRGPT